MPTSGCCTRRGLVGQGRTLPHSTGSQATPATTTWQATVGSRGVPRRLATAPSPAQQNHPPRMRHTSRHPYRTLTLPRNRGHARLSGTEATASLTTTQQDTVAHRGRSRLAEHDTALTDWILNVPRAVSATGAAELSGRSTWGGWGGTSNAPSKPTTHPTRGAGTSLSRHSHQPGCYACMRGGQTKPPSEG